MRGRTAFGAVVFLAAGAAAGVAAFNLRDGLVGLAAAFALATGGWLAWLARQPSPPPRT